MKRLRQQDVATVLLCAVTAIAVLRHSPGPIAAAEHRQQSLACAVDALGAPYAWGVASAVANLPHVSAMGVARWAARSYADAYFLPVDSCSLLAAEPTYVNAYRCFQDSAFCVLLGVPGLEPLALWSNELLSLLLCTLARAGDDRRNHAALYLTKTALFAFTPEGGVTQFYFFALQLDVMFASIQAGEDTSERECEEPTRSGVASRVARRLASRVGDYWHRLVSMTPRWDAKQPIRAHERRERTNRRD